MDNERRKLMLVDDNITNLTMGKSVLSDQYDVYTIPSGKKLFQLLSRVFPDLILLDIEMPGMNGYEVIRVLKSNPRTEGIPVIFLTAKNDPGSELEGLSLGAVDYITKPFSSPLLLKRIELHLLVESQKKSLKDYNDNLQEMVSKKTETVVTLQNAVLQTVAELVECRDDITGGHVERTQRFLRVLVEAMAEQEMYLEEITPWQNDEFFFQSVQLHDVGKIAIRDSILMKPGKLTFEEYEEMKSHTIFGGKVIEKIGRTAQQRSFLEHARIFATTHHEKWDGSGYPYGLRGAEIPLQGRLMAVADVYDALISERPYKKAIPHDDAVEIILAGRGTHFDPALADLFYSVSDRFLQVTVNWSARSDSVKEMSAELDQALFMREYIVKELEKDSRNYRKSTLKQSK